MPADAPSAPANAAHRTGGGGPDAAVAPGPRPALSALRMDLSKIKNPMKAAAVNNSKEALPSPHLTLPVPPRALRQSPSLPAGFSSIHSRRTAPRAPLLDTGLAVGAAGPSSRFRLRVDCGVADDPDSPTLLSPRVAEFTASPFHRTSAGDLAGSSIFEHGLLSPGAVARDPRSPAVKGEAPITRSIDEVL